jgi:hypothetical protein
VWTYVPAAEHLINPSEEYPICQTYVDVCIHGCLKWGGRELAHEFVHTTTGWSHFWLNDAPMSRRPWLQRPKYSEIDEVLGTLEGGLFNERRHPEEFSSHWQSSLRGLWGVPPKNPYFIGRETELEQITSGLHNAEVEAQGQVGVTTIETVGLGGVGKTQVAIEYCYRNYAPTAASVARSSRPMYGLVIWLRAESAEALASDIRNLASDSGIVVQAMRNEEVVSEIRSRLYKCKCPWLLVSPFMLFLPYFALRTFLASSAVLTGLRQRYQSANA